MNGVCDGFRDERALARQPQPADGVYTQIVTPFQVGDWHVQPSLNRLSRGGDEVRLEPKVMQVLEALAQKPGDVVTREELVAQVWPGVFVTDDVLHRAIRELRRVFGDDTANPAYVETIRKRGYRLIAPVRRGASFLSAAAPGVTVEDAPAPAAIVRPAAVRPFRFTVAFGLLGLALGAVVYTLASRPETTPAESGEVRFVALTSSPTNEGDPSPSPDGKRLAFSTRPFPGSVGQSDIFISDGPGGTPVRLTTHPADDRLTAWAPDATTLAFARIDGRTCDVMLIALADRRERKLASCGNVEDPHLAWSPDGEWLVESFAPGPDPVRGWQIARISTASGVREELTMPMPGTLGDHSPSVSPDGTRIAFVRGINGATADIHLMPFNGGAVTRLTWDNQDIVGLDWLPDGRSIVFSSDRAGGYSVFRVPVDGGDAQVVAGGSAKLKHPAVARGSGQIAYESWAYEINLWESPVSPTRYEAEGDALALMRPVVQTSDLWNHSPDISPDGSLVTFVSTRSGEPQVWIAGRDGSSPRQLSHFTRPAFKQPRWSPDGTRVLINASVLGRPDIYVIDAATGETTRLTDDEDDEVAPAWSRDGASVLFGARRSGTWQVMRLTIVDRVRTQVTTSGGYAPIESPDGKAIYFTRLDHPGVWMVPASGGEPRQVVSALRVGENTNWRLTPHGIFFVATTLDQPVIRRAPLDGGQAVDVASIANYSWPGFAVAPDGKSVIFARWDRRDSNILAIETRQ